MNQADIAGAVQLLRANAPISNVKDIYGENVQKEALRQLDREKLKGLSFGSLIAKQEREVRQHFRDRSAAGIKTYRVSNNEHDQIIRYIWESIARREQPAVSTWLKQYAHTNNLPLEWVRNASKCINRKRMRQSFSSCETSSIIELLKTNGFWSPSHKRALFNSTYTGIASLLTSWLSLLTELIEIRERLSKSKASEECLQQRLAYATSDVRDWRSEASSLYSQGKSFGEISKAVGKAKSTVHDYLRLQAQASSPHI